MSPLPLSTAHPRLRAPLHNLKYISCLAHHLMFVGNHGSSEGASLCFFSPALAYTPPFLNLYRRHFHSISSHPPISYCDTLPHNFTQPQPSNQVNMTNRTREKWTTEQASTPLYSAGVFFRCSKLMPLSQPPRSLPRCDAEFRHALPQDPGIPL